MADLTDLEKMKFEKLFGMSSGYVLSFSNRSFSEFILNNLHINIYGKKYEYLGTSKANRLRAFWNIEPNPMVGDLLLRLLDHFRDIKQLNDQIISKSESSLLDECYEIASRLKQNQPRITSPDYKVNKSDVDYDSTDKLKTDLVKLTNLKPQERGFAFEKFLNELFTAYNLRPRSSFRNIGEQIDGSFQIGADTYLVEAKWHDKPIDQAELLIFRGKVEAKASWARGLFISYSGFTSEGLSAYSKGRSTNIIGMDGQDLYSILNGEASLIEAINLKVRRATESGEFFVSVFLLARGN